MYDIRLSYNALMDRARQIMADTFYCDVATGADLVRQANGLFGSVRGVAGLAAARMLAVLHELPDEGLTLNALTHEISEFCTYFRAHFICMLGTKIRILIFWLHRKSCDSLRGLSIFRVSTYLLKVSFCFRRKSNDFLRIFIFFRNFLPFV